ncbi:MAG: cell division protein FtsL [candidate division KSB1 bacterium]|nr:cell division protein FtsL [candidate division KSB1 bacterium]MDZ7272453.1 cell division protein FtsL [candidate division KSB1 bacterium]MDZ7284523.1 cell division protein FtsL [candidate division KSB1 bacterium]MDZ7347948.1 cell division protein FtsL [candidate division KSB1 bacterium]MDZ7354410.1 cell division protein FtsL [candidate division KSB1 bacterium]
MASPKTLRHAPVRRSNWRRAGTTATLRPAPSAHRGPSDRSAGRTWAALLAPFLLLLVMGLLLIWLRVAVGDLAAAVARAEAQKRELQEENTRLLVRAEQLAGYGRIAKIAREHLHMTRVASKLIVVTQE